VVAGPDHPYVAEVAYERALTLGVLGKLGAAKASAERALKIFEDKKRAYDVARTQLVLAHLIAAEGADDDERVKSLREHAEAGLAERGQMGQRAHEIIDAWAKDLDAA
jgi:hypothetical protein